jgi:hypothetical protein
MDETLQGRDRGFQSSPFKAGPGLERLERAADGELSLRVSADVAGALPYDAAATFVRSDPWSSTRPI